MRTDSSKSCGWGACCAEIISNRSLDKVLALSWPAHRPARATAISTRYESTAADLDNPNAVPNSIGPDTFVLLRMQM
jgi:hypothetical protein